MECTRTATSARASEVSATSPSIPAVLRPALRCVTCRTLNSVFDRERNISFCRLLTLGQSPSCVALKIRCRSRRTSRSQPDQSTQSQSTASRPSSGRGSSGPFTTRWRLTCPSVPAVPADRLQRLTCPCGRAFAPGGPRPGIRPVMRDDQRRADRPRLVSCRLSAAGIGFLGILYPPGNSVLRYLRLTATLDGVADPDGVSVFRTHETRLGLGAPCTPGTVVSTRPHTILGRRLPPSNGRSLSSRPRKPSQDVQLTRHQRGFTGIHPMPSLPLACRPRTEREPLGFPVSFAPDRCWRQRPRTSRWGQVLGH